MYNFYIKIIKLLRKNSFFLMKTITAQNFQEIKDEKKNINFLNMAKKF